MEIISDAQEIRTRMEQFQATKDPKLKNTNVGTGDAQAPWIKKDRELLARSQELF